MSTSVNNNSRSNPFLMALDASAFLSKNDKIISFKDMKRLALEQQQMIKTEFGKFYSEVLKLQTIDEVKAFPHQGDKMDGEATQSWTEFEKWLHKSIFLSDISQLNDRYHDVTNSDIRGDMYETRTKLRALFGSILIQKALSLRIEQFPTIHDYNAFFTQARNELESLWTKYPKSNIQASIMTCDEKTQSLLVNFYLTLREAVFWRPHSDKYPKTTLSWKTYAVRLCSLAVNEGIWFSKGSGATAKSQLVLNIIEAFFAEEGAITAANSASTKPSKRKAKDDGTTSKRNTVAKKESTTASKKQATQLPLTRTDDLTAMFLNQQPQQATPALMSMNVSYLPYHHVPSSIATPMYYQSNVPPIVPQPHIVPHTVANNSFYYHPSLMPPAFIPAAAHAHISNHNMHNPSIVINTIDSDPLRLVPSFSEEFGTFLNSNIFDLTVAEDVVPKGKPSSGDNTDASTHGHDCHDNTVSSSETETNDSGVSFDEDDFDNIHYNNFKAFAVECAASFQRDTPTSEEVQQFIYDGRDKPRNFASDELFVCDVLP